VQILQDNIDQLEARIQELQNPRAPISKEFQYSQTSANMALRLHQPYDSLAPGSTIQDPPRQVAENLYVLFYHDSVDRLLIPGRINHFLQFATEFGFFLNIPRFHASMLQNSPIGHPTRPSPALVYSTYLFAIRISDDLLVKPNETAYLSRATQEAATALSGSHPHKVIHSIQAEVLLAIYFFSKGRFFEGKYHVANAVSTTVSAGLHKLRSSGPTSLVTLPSHRDAIEEGERIICAWNVFNLDKCWAIALNDSPNFEHSTHALAAKIDTPWPLDMDEFEQVSLFIYHKFRFHTDTDA
jgi:Fungal specific transcription factor domain